MKIISEANKNLLKILGKIRQADNGYRMLRYCVETPVEEGVLFFNLLTREMVLLTEDEYQNRMQLDYLKEHWFIVPENTNDKEYADLVRWVAENKQKKAKNITGYTIFTTTDCNARCFYCFELGRSRVPMSVETAHKVAAYIVDHCGGEKVNLRWFGGEPLFNPEVIDIICNGLGGEGIVFNSRMISNGYLFNEEIVEKAVKTWNLKQVQITLDGTEAVYTKVKAFIYREGNPYQTVLDNIGRLLDASIGVSIRLNMDMHNAGDLLQLVDELASRFGGRKGLTVYAHHLFKGNEPMAAIHTDAEWEIRHEAMCRLNEKIAQHGLAAKQGISKTIKLNFCMADSGSAVTILPGGDIGLCEHFSESEFIGHIDREGFDTQVVESWKETIPEIPECAECFYYPSCLQLKKCASGSVCFKQLRQDKLRKTQQQMINEYEKWQKQEASDEDQEEIQC